MPKSDDDFTLINSVLGGYFTKDEVTVEVWIYRGDAERSWILEVVDEQGDTLFGMRDSR